MQITPGADEGWIDRLAEVTGGLDIGSPLAGTGQYVRFDQFQGGGLDGVPVIMVSGDQTACAQMNELLGDVETAVVKQASGRFSAECLSPQASQELIYEAACHAVERLAEGDVNDPFVLDTPIRVTVEFFTSDMADRAAKMPFTQREGTRISFSANEMETAYSAFRTMVALALGS